MGLLREALLALGLQATSALASCAYGTHLAPRQEGKTVPTSTFGYSGTIGPTNWITLDPANFLCSIGRRQSPIDMVDGQFSLLSASDIALSIGDLPDGAKFENLGSTVEVVAPEGLGTISLANTEFSLQQFHFHLPSEHLDNGTSRAMEMHMVWESEAGNIAVIGVYIDVEGMTLGNSGVQTGDESANTTTTGNSTEAASKRWMGRFSTKRSVEAETKRNVQTRETIEAASPANFLEILFQSLPEIAQPGSITTTSALSMAELVQLISAGDLQAYVGSLTTPPCSEGVSWMVSTQRLKVSLSSFAAVRDVIGFNARFPQNALGDPNVLQSGALAVMQSLQAVVGLTSIRTGLS